MRNVLYILILTLFSSLILIAQDSSPFNYSIPNFQVSDSFDSLSNHSPSIAVDEDKNFGITWIEKSDGSSNICVKFYDSNGNKLRGKIKVTADTSNVNQKQPSIVKKMNSHYAICWSEEYKGGSDIYLQLFTYNGIAIDYNILVNDDSLSAWNRDPQIGMNSSGDFVIVWTYIHNGITDIAAQLFLNDGAKSGSNIIIIHEKEVKADYLSPHVYLNNNGDFIIVWIVEPYGSNEVYLCSQKYSAEGNKVGDKIIVNETTAIIPWYATPSISGDIFGNYVITWIDERNDLMGDIYLQRYSFEDKKTGANEKINDDNDPAFQRYPSISMKKEGEYIITWLDLRRDNAGIYGQRFDSFGGKIESNFKITRDISCNQNEFDVNLWDKRIYNAWGSQREDNTGSDIWVNALDWDNPSTSIIDNKTQILKNFDLAQNYPNPFNPSTTIKYQLPSNVKSEKANGSKLNVVTGYIPTVRLVIYDILGKEVATLVNQKQKPGNYEVTWEANNQPSGVYFYQLTVGNSESSLSADKAGSGQGFVETKKMILMR